MKFCGVKMIKEQAKTRKAGWMPRFSVFAPLFYPFSRHPWARQKSRRAIVKGLARDNQHVPSPFSLHDQLFRFVQNSYSYRS
jgi:hypothetical protein